MLQCVQRSNHLFVHLRLRYEDRTAQFGSPTGSSFGLRPPGGFSSWKERSWGLVICS